MIFGWRRHYDQEADRFAVYKPGVPGKMAPTDEPNVLRRVGLDGETLGFLVDGAAVWRSQRLARDWEALLCACIWAHAPDLMRQLEREGMCHA